MRPAARIWLLWVAGVVAVLGVARASGYVGAPTPGRPGGFLWPLFAWDFDLYRYIARHGYTPFPSPTFAFFPVWPGVLRLGGAVLAGIVALVASLAAFLGVARLDPDAEPQRVAIALACWPGSFALALVYPDALAIAAGAWACVCAARGRWAAAFVLGALCAAARPPGVLVAVPLFTRSRRAALGPVLAAIGVHAYFWVQSGVPDAFVRAQSGWGRHGLASRPWLVLGVVAAVVVVALTRRLRPLAFVAALAFIVAKTRSWQAATETLRAAIALPLAFVLVRLGPRYRIWAWYSAAVLAVSLASGSVQSFGRQALLAFPLAWAGARVGNRWLAVGGGVANAALLLTLTHFAP